MKLPFNIGLGKTRLRQLSRNVMAGGTDFITTMEMTECTRKWCRSLPQSYDLIVGIPRSGMMVASIMATSLGKPLASPDTNDLWIPVDIPQRKIESILVVEDTISVGVDLNKGKTKVRDRFPYADIQTGSLFISESNKHLVDIYYKIMPKKQWYCEWNIMHHGRNFVFDMDGVLCEDCQVHDKHEDDYTNWMAHAKPYLIPTYEIDCIITNRIEKYRTITEQWLSDHHVRYRKLIMNPSQSNYDRDYGGILPVQYKSEILCKMKVDMFIESSPLIAKGVHDNTGIPCLATDSMEMFS